MTLYMNKEKIIIISLIFLFVYNSNAQNIQVLERKIISTQVTDCDMHCAKVLFNDSNNVLISMEQLLYADNNLIRIGTLTMYSENDKPVEINGVENYCCNFLGGFAKNSRFYIAFGNISTVDIYGIQKDRLNCINSITSPKFEISPQFEKVIAIPGQEESYYLFGHYETLPFNPFERARTFTSFGHGVYYYKPYLAEAQNGKIARCIKLDYGGKIDESYIVHEIAVGKDSIHFFGFRNVDVSFIGNLPPIKLIEPYGGYGLKTSHFRGGNYYQDRDITQSVILYYSDYNIKKEKNTRKCKIYENTPGYDKKTDTYCDYGVLSTDSQNDSVYAVFSWVKWQKFQARYKYSMGKGLSILCEENFNINDVNSSIYFWQCNDKAYGKAEKIAEGFCPLVRVDQFGIIYVFWVDRSGNIIQKVKKDGKWSNEEIILSSFSTKPVIYTKRCSIKVEGDRPDAILYTKFFAAEFDKENNLHAVYPTAEGIVYTKMKLE